MIHAILRAARRTGKVIGPAIGPAVGPAILAMLCLLSAATAAQRSPFDIDEGQSSGSSPGSSSGSNTPEIAGKSPYAGPQTTSKPPPLPEDQSPFASGPIVPRQGRRQARGGPVPTGRPFASGTGFVVAPGRVMTNNHVVADCGRTVARNAAGTRVEARVLGTDRRRDLAVLDVPTDLGPALAFRANPPVRRGEPVVIYGFPLYGLLSSGPTLTTGVLSALSGIKDTPLNFEITAPVNPGNSGGPMLDDHGHVIGVVVAKINAMRVAQLTDGDIPQNINFAVKGTEALAFLRAQNVTPRTEDSVAAPRTAADIGDIANPSTMFLECFR